MPILRQCNGAHMTFSAQAKTHTSMLVAPASRLFSTSSLHAVAKSNMTCPEHMRCTEALSIAATLRVAMLYQLSCAETAAGRVIMGVRACATLAACCVFNFEKPGPQLSLSRKFSGRHTHKPAIAS